MENNIYKCPNCGSSLEVSGKIDTFFCTYCGTKIHSGDINRINAQLEIKRLEYKDKQREEGLKVFKLSMMFLLALMVIIFLLFLLIFLSEKNDSEEKIEGDNKIIIEYNKVFFDNKKYKYLYDYSKDNALKKVKIVEMEEKAYVFQKFGDVDIVIIDGRSDYSQGSLFDSDA